MGRGRARDTLRPEALNLHVDDLRPSSVGRSTAPLPHAVHFAVLDRGGREGRRERGGARVTDRMGLAPAAERRARLDARHPAWTPMTLSQALDAAAEDFADRPLVIAGE